MAFLFYSFQYLVNLEHMVCKDLPRMLFALLKIISAYLLLKVYIVYADTPHNTEILLVHVIFRHGERTTLDFYPTDPHRNETFYPFGLSSLTNKGKRMMFVLGENLRKRYGYFLGQDYTARKLEVRSTDTERTIMSALLVLAGLWPPSDKQKWHPSFNWQPIPVFSKPLQEEDLLDDLLCKHRNKILYELPNNSTVQNVYFKPHRELITYVENYSGLKIHDFRDLLGLYFILKAEDDYGLELPEWTKSIYPEPLHQAAASVYGYTNFDPIVKTIQAGYLLQKILNDSLAKINSNLEQQQRKMYMYSAHESTLANFLDALQVFSPPEVPPYGSAIVIELHTDKKDYYLKLQYWKHPLNSVTCDLTLPNCTTLCPFDKFAELTSKLLPDISYRELCAM